MEVVISKGIGNFYFTDDFKTMKAKASGYSAEEGERSVLDIRYKTLFIEALEIYMKFDQAAETVDYFEIKRSASFTIDGLDVFATPMDALTQHFLTRDAALEITEDGFLSKKMGLGIYADLADRQYSDTPGTLILYKEGYLEQQPGQEELGDAFMEGLDDYMNEEDLLRFGEEFVSSVRDKVFGEYRLVKSGKVKSDHARLWASFEPATRSEIDRLLVDSIDRLMQQALAFFEHSRQWTIAETYYLDDLDHYDRAEVCAQFLPDFLKNIESDVVAHLPHDEKAGGVVHVFVTSALQQLSTLFEESDYGVVERSSLEGTGTRHLTAMGKALSGELTLWIEKFSRFEPGTVDEKQP